MDQGCVCVFKHGRRIHVCGSCPPLVIIESPFAGDLVKNLEYAKIAMLDSIGRGEAPFASHLIFPQVLNDLDYNERAKGMILGFAWGRFADKVAVYEDLGQSEGMLMGIRIAKTRGIPVEYRNLL